MLPRKPACFVRRSVSRRGVKDRVVPAGQPGTKFSHCPHGTTRIGARKGSGRKGPCIPRAHLHQLWCYSQRRGGPTRISDHCGTRRGSGRIGPYFPDRRSGAPGQNRRACCGVTPRGAAGRLGPAFTMDPARGSGRTGLYPRQESRRTRPTRRADRGVIPGGAEGRLGSVLTAVSVLTAGRGRKASVSGA